MPLMVDFSSLARSGSCGQQEARAGELQAGRLSPAPHCWHEGVPDPSKAGWALGCRHVSVGGGKHPWGRLLEPVVPVTFLLWLVVAGLSGQEALICQGRPPRVTSGGRTATPDHPGSPVPSAPGLAGRGNRGVRAQGQSPRHRGFPLRVREGGRDGH